MVRRGSQSIQSYLWQTRLLAAVAGVALLAGIVSDALAPHFWNRHSLLAGLASNFIVVVYDPTGEKARAV